MSGKPREVALRFDSLEKIVGSNNADLIHKYINDLGGSLFLREDEPADAISKRLNACLSIMESIEPKDPIEVQLVLQIISSHNVAMECLRRSNLDGQGLENRNMNLTHANKFLRLHMDQLSALNKYRGKGQQKVVVEHVNVAAGGQAIVGNVSTRGPAQKAPEMPVLSHQPAQTIDIAIPTPKEPLTQAKRRKKT